MGPSRLLNYARTEDPIAGFSSPLTPALGLSIGSNSRMCPCAEGTGGLYLSINDKVYILTARHVVFPLSIVPNRLFDHMQDKKHLVPIILPGSQVFQDMLLSITYKINSEDNRVDNYKTQLDRLETEQRGKKHIQATRTVIETELEKAKASVKALDKFHSDVTKVWSQESHCRIGRVAYAPPITVGADHKRYTEDWALIELDRDKFDWDNFRGNVIDLGMILSISLCKAVYSDHYIPGTELTLQEFTCKMVMYSDNKARLPLSFEYPYDRLFPIQGIVPEEELTRARAYDPYGMPFDCFFIKNGCGTKTTIGRASGIKSFVRDILPDGNEITSMELAILGRDKYESFSGRRDSGAIIVDEQGRIVALLTGGTGGDDDIDITYGTPFEWLWERIRARFPDINIYPSEGLD